jgi:hypothetical protein
MVNMMVRSCGMAFVRKVLPDEPDAVIGENITGDS